MLCDLHHRKREKGLETHVEPSLTRFRARPLIRSAIVARLRFGPRKLKRAEV